MAKKVSETPSQAEANVGEILSRSERFIDKYKKQIIIGVSAVILLAVAVLSLHNFYFLPKEKEAQAALFRAEQAFAMQEWDLALNGDGESIGFLGVINQYGSTKPGNLAKAYAGISYFKKGQIEDAMNYLKQFKTSDQVISPVAIGLIGDCYVESGNIKESVSYFKKAADMASNESLSPTYLYKAGLAYEELGDNKGALSVYKEIKNKYPQAAATLSIEQFILKLSLNN